MHAAACGTIHFDEDTTGEFVTGDEMDATQKRGLQKRYHRFVMSRFMTVTLRVHLLYVQFL